MPAGPIDKYEKDSILIFGNGTDITPLSHGAGVHRFSGGSQTDGVIICQFRQLSGRTGIDHIGNIVNGLGRDCLSVGDHLQQSRDCTGGKFHLCTVPLYPQFFSAADHTNVIPLLQQLEVFVKAAA